MTYSSAVNNAGKRPREHDILGKVRGAKDKPTDRGIHALTSDFPTLTREKCHGSSRPDPHETRISRVTQIVADRIGSGRFRRISKPRGSGRVGSRVLQNLTGRVGSGQEISKSRGSGRVGSRCLEILAGRVGSGRVGSRRLEILTGRARSDPTREI